jgi:hypothetical protein
LTDAGVIFSSHGLSVLPDVLVRSSLMYVDQQYSIPLTVIVCLRVIPGWSVRW